MQAGDRLLLMPPFANAQGGLDGGPAQRTGPEMLDVELRLFLGQFAGLEALQHHRLMLHEALGAFVL